MIKRKEIREAQLFLKSKEHIEIQKNNRRFKRAKRDLNKILKVIIDNYNPKKIYIWGSILNQDKFREYSDIDIGLEGILSAKVFFKLYGDIMFLTKFSIDIVQLEKIEPEFRDIILMKGKLIYEKK